VLHLLLPLPADGLNMRSVALIAAFAAIARASSPPNSGFIYTFDQTPSAPATEFIDSALASAIIARRRELTDSRYLNVNNAAMLDDINTYGGWQRPLFGDGAGEAPGKLFIRITDFNGGRIVATL
jgi:hypothetical protein